MKVTSVIFLVIYVFSLCEIFKASREYEWFVENDSGTHYGPSNHAGQYQWRAVTARVTDDAVHSALKSATNTWAVPTSQYVSLPVYVSLATVSYRIHVVHLAIQAILHGTVIPSHIYLFVSRSPFLMDRGIRDIPSSLLKYVATQQLSVIFTDNYGPHRKLLPLLGRYYDDDVIIITVDDDLVYYPNNTIVENLLQGYVQTQGSAVVALRSRRIGFCHAYPHDFLTYTQWSVCDAEMAKTEMLLLPTGTGGILYRTRFFPALVFSSELRNITATSDDIMFRLCTMANNVPVRMQCRPIIENGLVTNRCQGDLAVRRELTSKNKSTTRVNETIYIPEYSRKVASSQGGKSLYKGNRRGMNDLAWSAAVQYLESHNLLSFQNLLNAHYLERETECYHQRELTNKQIKRCAVMNCQGQGKAIMARI